MALLQVLSPRTRPREQDTLDKITRGLQAASILTGIVINVKDIFKTEKEKTQTLWDRTVPSTEEDKDVTLTLAGKDVFRRFAADPLSIKDALDLDLTNKFKTRAEAEAKLLEQGGGSIQDGKDGQFIVVPATFVSPKTREKDLARKLTKLETERKVLAKANDDLFDVTVKNSNPTSRSKQGALNTQARIGRNIALLVKIPINHEDETKEEKIARLDELSRIPASELLQGVVTIINQGRQATDSAIRHIDIDTVMSTWADLVSKITATKQPQRRGELLLQLEESLIKEVATADREIKRIIDTQFDALPDTVKRLLPKKMKRIHDQLVTFPPFGVPPEKPKEPKKPKAPLSPAKQKLFDKGFR